MKIIAPIQRRRLRPARLLSTSSDCPECSSPIYPLNGFVFAEFLLRGQFELVCRAHHIAAAGADFGSAGVLRSAVLAHPFLIDVADSFLWHLLTSASRLKSSIEDLSARSVARAAQWVNDFTHCGKLAGAHTKSRAFRR